LFFGTFLQNGFGHLIELATVDYCSGTRLGKMPEMPMLDYRGGLTVLNVFQALALSNLFLNIIKHVKFL
jgi:hypothetical protein